MATAWPSEVAATARLVLGLARRRPAAPGGTRVVCVDGPAGSGKTTLGRALAAAAPEAVLLHMDDLYDGWAGLEAGVEQLRRVLRALAEGRPGRYRRYDWHAGRYGPEVAVPVAPLLVAEGVGSGAAAVAPEVLVWVDAPEELRLRRGLARDGAALEPQWRRWLAAEAGHFARAGTRARADVVVDGTGAAAPVVRAGPPG